MLVLNNNGVFNFFLFGGRMIFDLGVDLVRVMIVNMF